MQQLRPNWDTYTPDGPNVCVWIVFPTSFSCASREAAGDGSNFVPCLHMIDPVRILGSRIQLGPALAVVGTCSVSEWKFSLLLHLSNKQVNRLFPFQKKNLPGLLLRTGRSVLSLVRSSCH